MDDTDDFRPRNYPIRDEIDYQRKVWRFERFGWFLLGLLTLATLLGAFSQGVISDREERSGGLSVEYDFFERNGAVTRLVISARGDPDKPVEFELSGAFMKSHDIEAIQPVPVAAGTTANGGLRFTLSPASTGSASAYITTRPNTTGLIRSEFASGESRLPITQFIYP